MAGPLTWRDVSAPNFAPAMQGYQMFSDLLNNAFSSAERGLAKYDGQRNDAANRVAMFNAMTEQDPEALKAKLADGSLFNGVDLARLSPETIAAADSRVGTLLNRSLTEENLENTRYTNDRTQSQNSQRDAASPALAALAEAHRSGDTAAIAAAEAKYGAAARSVPYQDLLPNMSALEGLENTALSQRGSRQSYNQSEISFAQGQQDRKDAEAATDYLARAQLNAGGDPELLLGAINSSDLSPGARRQAWQMLGGVGAIGSIAGGGGGSGGAGGGSGGGGDFSMGGAQQEVVSRFKNSSMSDPVIAGFLGNFHVEGGYGGAQGDGGSAGGIAQWRGNRRTNFQKRYGVDPTKATAAQQADYVVWELTTPQGRKSAGITDKQARAILDAKTPQEAAGLIDQYYERSSGAHRNRRINAADTAHRYLTGDPITRNPAAADASRITSMRNDINGVAATFNNGWNANSNRTAIATELTKKGGLLEGGNAAQISDMIENIKQNANVNDAIAGNILANSLTRYKPADWKTLWGTTENVYGELAKGYTVDKDKIDWFQKQFRDNGVLRTQDRENRLTIDRAQLPVLQSQIQELRARESRIANMGDNTRQAQENLNRVRAQRLEKERQLEAQQGQIVSRERALRDSLQYQAKPGNSLFTVRPAGSKPKPKDETDGSWFRVRRAGDK